MLLPLKDNNSDATHHHLDDAFEAAYAAKLEADEHTLPAACDESLAEEEDSSAGYYRLQDSGFISVLRGVRTECAVQHMGSGWTELSAKETATPLDVGESSVEQTDPRLYKWLQAMQLEHLTAKFTRNGYTDVDLMCKMGLDDDDLDFLGIDSAEHREVLKKVSLSVTNAAHEMAAQRHAGPQSVPDSRFQRKKAEVQANKHADQVKLKALWEAPVGPELVPEPTQGDGVEALLKARAHPTLRLTL